MADIDKLVSSYKSEMIKTMSDIIAIPAIAPSAGGKGESKRADFVERKLNELGLHARRFDYKDETGTVRSNLVAKHGNSKSTIWLLSHLDTVSPGDLSLWRHDPFDAYVESGRLYGRGSSDNGQGIVSSLFAAKALLESKANTRYNIGLAFVADEETGSKYGVIKLLKEGIFGKNDLMIVPDWGTEKGNAIEIAEKGILWLKFKVVGKQVHASTPQLGINAYRVSILLLSRLDELLHKKYALRNKLFEPPFSTFEMTKHEANVDSTNIVPGTETFYMDCRVLPSYKLGSVISDIQKVAKQIERSTGARISIDVVSREDSAKPVSASSPIVKLLSKSIEKVKKTKVKLVGIGGGTVAKYFRDAGLAAAVWATLPDNAHQPDEYLIIEDMLSDTKVFANIFL